MRLWEVDKPTRRAIGGERPRFDIATLDRAE
jgi:hypothetical protein